MQAVFTMIMFVLAAAALALVIVLRNKIGNALLYWLSGYLRCRLILDSGKERNHLPYLERYYICTIPFTDRHAYLHRFLASDSSNLHDHPWRWALSLLICGWYWEDRRWGRAAVRFFNWLTGESFHRIDLVPGVYTWSIFITGPRCKKWGMAEPYFGGTIGDHIGRISEAFKWSAYEYGAKDKNEDAIALDWTRTYPRGKNSKRERMGYVTGK